MSSITESLFGSDDPEEAARDAAEIQSQWQIEALEYLKETEAVPQEQREKALTGLGDYFQVPGEQLGQGALIAQAKESPLYEAILGGREAGEEGILRAAGATGGLRSGNVQDEIFSYNANLENEALLSAYNEAQKRQDYERGINISGLEGLAYGTPSNANAIAAQMGAVGSTQAQGITSATAAGMQKNVGITSDAIEIAKMAVQAYSDIRLKDNIEYIGDKNGHHWYSWDWNEEAEELGLSGESQGVMAHQLYEYMPEAIGEKEGYITVNYSMLEH